MGDMLLMPPCFTATAAFRDSSFPVNIALATDTALTEYVNPRPQGAHDSVHLYRELLSFNDTTFPHESFHVLCRAEFFVIALISSAAFVRYSSHTIDRVAFWNSVRVIMNLFVNTKARHVVCLRLVPSCFLHHSWKPD